MEYKGIIEKVSENTGIPIEVVDKVYKAFWLYIRKSIQELPLKKELTEAEFLLLKPNFNIPSLGKLCLSYDRYKGVKAKFSYIKNLKNRDNKYIKEKEEDL